MNTIPTITIGIPALNEEANIGMLIHSLVSQSDTTFKLEQIIVVSDASTDNTDSIVSEISKADPRVTLIRNPKRKGCQYGQNRVFKESDTDIVVLMDADNTPGDQNTIANLIHPIINSSNISLVGGHSKPTKANNFFQAILNFAAVRNHQVFEQLNNGQTYFLCPGSIRAFKKDLYKHLTFPNVAGEDMYSFMFAAQHNYGFAYAHNAIAYFTAPYTIADHEKQSIRFVHAQKNIQKLFGKDFTAPFETIPKKMLLQHLTKSFFANPIMLTAYISLLIYMRVRAYIKPKNVTGMWEIVTSSKHTISEGAKL